MGERARTLPLGPTLEVALTTLPVMASPLVGPVNLTPVPEVNPVAERSRRSPVVKELAVSVTRLPVTAIVPVELILTPVPLVNPLAVTATALPVVVPAVTSTADPEVSPVPEIFNSVPVVAELAVRAAR